MMREQRPVTLAAMASAVGYASESAFGKVFRRVLGVSPGQYRQNHQCDTQQTGGMRGFVPTPSNRCMTEMQGLGLTGSNQWR
jgi:AraC-like DNA-binding protein